jgi:hypothetical protein
MRGHLLADASQKHEVTMCWLQLQEANSAQVGCMNGVRREQRMFSPIFFFFVFFELSIIVTGTFVIKAQSVLLCALWTLKQVTHRSAPQFLQLMWFASLVTGGGERGIRQAAPEADRHLSAHRQHCKAQQQRGIEYSQR